ncbi:hypothetical protein ABEF95_001221 [Exophiala dermatitidis]
MAQSSGEQGQSEPTQQQSGIQIRQARVEEDDVLSRILCNAFLPVWNHNWFHGISKPLEPVQIGTVNGPTPPMTRRQKTRVRFYRSLVKLTRYLAGDSNVLVVDVPASGTDGTPGARDIGAILLWSPPGKRIKWYDTLNLVRSGNLALILPWHYGPSGFWRIEMIYEANVFSMFRKTLPDLPPSGFKEPQCGFIQMLATNSKYLGNGYASLVLKHRMDQHFVEFPDRPVILDTTTEQAIRAYTKLGYKILAQMPVDTGTDELGIWLSKSASEEVKRRGRETCIQTVMVKMPPQSQ